jgi:glutathione synthase/RimK-type ligase-like ATP-grasp enzyme
MSDFLGIARERVFSPGKVEADRAILEAVADGLRRRRHTVRIVSAEEPLPSPAAKTTVFTMCQGERALATMRAWERDGVRAVNSVESILNCHRHRMLECFARAEVNAPETLLLTTEAPPDWPEWIDHFGAWLKRGDVHATNADDVVFVQSHAEARAAVARFHARGIGRAILQRHVPGVVIKFYAVATGYLAWFLPAETAVELSAQQAAELRALAQSGARALGLEVYGGDCVASATEGLQLIDLNDWPSYARCRAAGAEAIVTYLEALIETSRQ